jgi:hypothetical protein
MISLKDLLNNSWDWKRTLILLLFITLFAILINIYLIPNREISADNMPTIYQNGTPYADLNSLKLNINQQMQNSIDSGNLFEIFWKIAYFGHNLDRLCYIIVNNPNNMTVILNDSSGRSYNITGYKCFDATKPLPNFSYILTFTMPSNQSNHLVDKSECVYYLNKSSPCIVNGVIYTCHTCLTNPITTEYTFPGIKQYFEAGLFYQWIKFLIILVFTSLLIKELLEVIKFIFKR